MSKLEELIERLCPDGVVYCKIKEVALVTAGNSAPQNQDYFKNGEYPFCRTSDVGKARKSIDFYDIADKINANGIKGLRLFPKGSILIPKSGASTLLNNKVRLSIDSFVVSHLAVIIPNEQIVDSRFLYYTIVDFDMSTLVEDRSYPSVKSSKIADSIWIPIPPLEVQQEIVRILDTFTTLEAELEARKKQYEFFKDELLTFSKDVEWKSIKEVADNYTGLTYKPTDTAKEGTLVLRSSNIIGSRLSFENNVFVKMDKIPERAIAKENDILVCVRNGSRSLIGKAALIPKTNEIMAFGAFMTILRAKKEIVNHRYLFYVWQSSQTQFDIKGDDAMPINQITNKEFARVKVPVPPLTEQERIVAILDRFDTLINDLSHGLPAEIAARRKQYEYYRNKLLTFKEVKHESV